MLESSLFWFIVSFVLFFVLLGRKIKSGLIASLDGYREKVKQEVLEAQSFKEEAQRLLSETQKKHRQILLEADEIIAQAKDEAVLIKDQASKDVDELIKKVEKSMKDKATQLETRTIADLKEATMGMSMEATKNLLVSKLSSKEQQKLIDESISFLEKK